MNKPPSRVDLDRAEGARCSRAAVQLSYFVQHTNRAYIMGWFHEELCLLMQWFAEQCATGKSPRLMLFGPPGHGKSEIVSRRFGPWFLGRHPTINSRHPETGIMLRAPTKVVICSYNDNLATKMSRDAREIARDPKVGRVFPGILPKRRKRRHATDYQRNDFDRVDEWRTGHGASFMSAGVGTALTGNHANALIIDDPVKDAADAQSGAKQTHALDWYTSTVDTRLIAGGGICLTMTPWAPGDLGQTLLRRDTEGEWTVVRFQAIAERDEYRPAFLAAWTPPWSDKPLGDRLYRRAGEPLHEARHPLARLEKIRAANDGLPWWDSLYMLRPRTRSGRVFWREHFRRFDLEANRNGPWDHIAIFGDLSFRKNKKTDHTCFAVWAWRGVNAYLIGVVWGRMSYTEQRSAGFDILEAHRNADALVVEGRANGDALIDDMLDELGLTAENPFYGQTEIKIAEPRNVKDRKLLDARAASAKVRKGEVYIPERAPWVLSWLEEHVGFTGAEGGQDDQVDTTSMMRIYEREHLVVESVDDERDQLWQDLYGG